MNIILLHEHEWANSKPFEVTLDDRRAEHILKTLRPVSGQTLRVGKLNGPVSQATVKRCNTSDVVLSVDPSRSQPPPAPSRIKLIIALPRPKTARRIVRTATELGVKTLHFINSYKVEKSYWQSPLLAREQIDRQIWMGLEQASDTVEPEIHFHKLFKPFVEDILPGLIQQQAAYLAHPDKQKGRPSLPGSGEPCWFAVGPEGGFTDYEVSRLVEMGCLPVYFGERVLRTETFIPFLLGRFLAG